MIEHHERLEIDCVQGERSKSQVILRIGNRGAKRVTAGTRREPSQSRLTYKLLPQRRVEARQRLMTIVLRNCMLQNCGLTVRRVMSIWTQIAYDCNLTRSPGVPRVLSGPRKRRSSDTPTTVTADAGEEPAIAQKHNQHATDRSRNERQHSA